MFFARIFNNYYYKRILKLEDVSFLVLHGELYNDLFKTNEDRLYFVNGMLLANAILQNRRFHNWNLFEFDEKGD